MVPATVIPFSKVCLAVRACIGVCAHALACVRVCQKEVCREREKEKDKAREKGTIREEIEEESFCSYEEKYLRSTMRATIPNIACARLSLGLCTLHLIPPSQDSTVMESFKQEEVMLSDFSLVPAPPRSLLFPHLHTTRLAHNPTRHAFRKIKDEMHFK